MMADGSSPKKIALVGCPRSGTSLFADYLVQCGLKTVDDLRSSKKYPSGYHEYFPLLVLHKALERYPRGSLHKITDEPFLSETAIQDPILSQLSTEAFKPFLDPEIDFIKYPQLALSMPFLCETYPDLHIIAIWRNPSSVFKSLIQKEFPPDMLPASAVRSILMQSVYADHIIRAQAAYPDRITILHIDSIISRNLDLSNVLGKLGYDVTGDKRLSDIIQPGIWTAKVSPLWMGFYLLTRFFIRVGQYLLAPEKRKFIEIAQYHRRLLQLCYECDHPDN